MRPIEVAHFLQTLCLEILGQVVFRVQDQCTIKRPHCEFPLPQLLVAFTLEEVQQLVRLVQCNRICLCVQCLLPLTLLLESVCDLSNLDWVSSLPAALGVVLCQVIEPVACVVTLLAAIPYFLSCRSFHFLLLASPLLALAIFVRPCTCTF